MKDDRLDDALRACFRAKPALDERLKSQTRRRICEKRERMDNWLLCMIQMALVSLSVTIAAAASIASRGILVCLLGHAVIGSLISAMILLHHSKKAMRNRGGESA